MSEKKESQEPVKAGSGLNDGLGGCPCVGCHSSPEACLGERDCPHVEVRAERDRYREELENIANAAWSMWESPMNTPAEFARWAQSRARHALNVWIYRPSRVEEVKP